ncbi:MAG: twin-arginine translocation signal domain-containing protein [Proteobacteria bacterium]|nr:twin-arginine translocation signal domain-containing protein [Pseudomonadota bacterium]MBU1739831.1 twin-arginine translocation signal domain-containing protein [Pseudomonadota bacterium]
MKDRRDFLKATAAVTAGIVTSRVVPALAYGGSSFPAGVVYTKDNPGKWAGKVGSHAPVVTINGRKVTIETKHPMSEAHFIVRHTLVSSTGEVLGDATFTGTDKKALSEYEVPAGHSDLYATSFCNQHDFWVTEFVI